MAHSNSARKRIRQNAKRRALNRWRMKTMRDAIRSFNDVIAHGTEADARAEFVKVQAIIDRTAQKGIIHPNQASRRKSRMSARVKAKKAGA